MDQTFITQAIVTIIVPILTQGVKKIQSIPINSGQTARVRTFVGIATFILTALGAYLNGNLESVLSPQMLEVGVVSAINFGIILLAHRGIKLVKES